MFERFTKDARRIVVLAQEEARLLSHNYVGTEHLLLALTSDAGPAGQALKAQGVTRDKARSHIVELIGEGMSAPNGHIPFIGGTRAVLQSAGRIALGFWHNHVGPEHLLLALVIDDRSSVQVAGQAILNCGAAPETVQVCLTSLMAASPAPAPEPGSGFALSA
ncbi:Clp protease N-terminal domain-containing protein (plasmid) [Pseudarthrobacter sp. P1]|uniref:Clp protease N-terminal domain-containing protein n=1 Tax=Pseudarthrobacter sp. P1 TaxID=3418418 RepID=UPI003CF5C079